MARKLRRLSVGLFAVALVPVTWWAVAKNSDAPPATRGLASGSPTPSAFSPSPTLTSSATPGLAFAEGACLSFSPDSGAERGAVFLDAGHGGLEPGAFGKTSDGRTVAEKMATLGIVQAATAAFRAEGYRVVVSRWADTTVFVPGAGHVRNGLLTPEGVRHDLLARIACANAAKADVLISVHLNAFSDPDVGGASTIYNAKRTFTADNRRLARLLQVNVLAEVRRAGWQLSDRRVMDDTANPGGALTERGARYGHSIIIGPYAKDWVPEPSAMPGAIMEPLFLTRPEEADIATSAKGQAALASAMTAAVAEFLAGR